MCEKHIKKVHDPVQESHCIKTHGTLLTIHGTTVHLQKVCAFLFIVGKCKILQAFPQRTALRVYIYFNQHTK